MPSRRFDVVVRRVGARLAERSAYWGNAVANLVRGYAINAYLSDERASVNIQQSGGGGPIPVCIVQRPVNSLLLHVGQAVFPGRVPRVREPSGCGVLRRFGEPMAAELMFPRIRSGGHGNRLHGVKPFHVRA